MANKTPVIFVCLMVLISGCSGFGLDETGNDTASDDSPSPTQTPESDRPRTPTTTPETEPTSASSSTPTTTSTQTPISNPVKRSFNELLEELDANTANKVREQAKIDGEIDKEDLVIAELLVNSSSQYREGVLEGVPYAEGWSREDSSILIGAAKNFYKVDPANPPSELVRLRTALAADGKISENDILFLSKLFDGKYNQSRRHSALSQMKDAGLLNKSIQDGSIKGSEIHYLTDGDNDFLIDGMEEHLETDDSDEDTDGDGLLDGWEVYLNETYPDADPNKKDIYVEVDRMENTQPLPEKDKQRLIERFENAPTARGGINLHLRIDETVPEERLFYARHGSGSMDDLPDYASEYFDHEGKGYHYALLSSDTPQFTFGDVLGGVALTDNPYFTLSGNINQSDDIYYPVGDLFMHELGHSIGLVPSVYRGIDSEKIAFSDYPSVMNYNRHDERIALYNYSNGNHSAVDFDDWGYIEQNLTTPSTENVAFG